MAVARLLISDSDPATRQSMRVVFSRNGWQVSEVATLAEALRGLETSPDWLVMSLTLTGQDGAVLLRTIRSRSLPTRVVVCLAPSESDRLTEIMALSPDLALTKPVDTAALFQACQILQAAAPPACSALNSPRH